MTLAADVLPHMIVVAGPPGSGKSTLFPVRGFGVDFFNADDQAAALNNGSYHDISLATRVRVNRTLETWIAEHIAERRSFAIETTLRTAIALQQAAEAAAAGFTVEMIFVSVDSFERSLERVKARAHAGGHSASPAKLKGIRSGSFETLRKAIDLCASVIDVIDIYDNSRFDMPPTHVATLKRSTYGAEIVRHTNVPDYLAPYLKSR